MKIKLTTSKLNKLEPPQDGKNQIFYWDTETLGLSLRVTKDNHRAYIFQSRVKDTSIRITIGNIKNWSLDEARIEARKLQRECDQGKDPRRLKKEEETKNFENISRLEKEKITFISVYNEYVEAKKVIWTEKTYYDALKLAKRSGQIKKVGVGLTKECLFESLLDVPLVSINTARLSEWLENENKTRKTSTAKAFRVLRACINWCQEHETYKYLIKPEVYKHSSVRDRVHKIIPRKQYIEPQNLTNWFKAVHEIDNVIHQALLKTCLLTGNRSEAVRSLKFIDIDTQNKSIKIWSKAHQDHILIPLTPYLEKTLSELPNWGKTEYIFHSEDAEKGYVVNIRKQYYRALKKYDLPIITVHDLRRSFSNLSEWVDTPVGVTAQIMGHKPSAIAEKHYKNRPVDLLRIHHIRIEEWILRKAEIMK